jgi:hypothetical protein
VLLLTPSDQTNVGLRRQWPNGKRRRSQRAEAAMV